MIHALLRKALEKNGFEICGDASNGKEAVEMFTRLSPDLTFMDITMPIMDGIEASTNIKKSNPQAKIIMLSAMGDEEIITQAKSIGIDIFLKKPFKEDMVMNAISALK
jgi:two-component system chemotaxis response regulator CheY